MFNILLPVFLLYLTTGFSYKTPAVLHDAPTLDQLNVSISKAQSYYEGLYKDFGNNTAVVAEYYSGDKSVYTVRHGVIGGYFYFSYTNDATKSAALLNFAKKYGFNIYLDDHSFVWTKTNKAPIGIAYSNREYHDCSVTLPATKNIFPYRSKVCKLGVGGQYIYSVLSRFDVLSPIETDLQRVESGQTVKTTNYENKYLGFGMPICTLISCDKNASVIRTAQFGLLELKAGKMNYADSVATDLISAQNDGGAIYLSYDKKYHLTNNKNVFYDIINKILAGKPFYKGYIPTNAESMNDSLAFLFQYRCAKYNVCN